MFRPSGESWKWPAAQALVLDPAAAAATDPSPDLRDIDLGPGFEPGSEWSELGPAPEKIRIQQPRTNNEPEGLDRACDQFWRVSVRVPFVPWLEEVPIFQTYIILLYINAAKNFVLII